MPNTDEKVSSFEKVFYVCFEDTLAGLNVSYKGKTIIKGKVTQVKPLDIITVR